MHSVLSDFSTSSRVLECVHTRVLSVCVLQLRSWVTWTFVADGVGESAEADSQQVTDVLSALHGFVRCVCSDVTEEREVLCFLYNDIIHFTNFTFYKIKFRY